MLNVNGTKIYTQNELLMNLTLYLEFYRNIDRDLRETISTAVAAMIDENPEYVISYLKPKLDK